MHKHSTNKDLDKLDLAIDLLLSKRNKNDDAVNHIIDIKAIKNAIITAHAHEEPNSIPHDNCSIRLSDINAKIMPQYNVENSTVTMKFVNNTIIAEDIVKTILNNTTNSKNQKHRLDYFHDKYGDFVVSQEPINIASFLIQCGSMNINVADKLIGTLWKVLHLSPNCTLVKKRYEASCNTMYRLRGHTMSDDNGIVLKNSDVVLCAQCVALLQKIKDNIPKYPHWILQYIEN